MHLDGYEYFGFTQLFTFNQFPGSQGVALESHTMLGIVIECWDLAEKRFKVIAIKWRGVGWGGLPWILGLK